MWKKPKLILLSSAFALAVTCNATNYVVAASGEETNVTEPQVTELEAQKPETPVNQNYIKIIFDNKVLYHEQVPTKTMIQVLNDSEEVLKSEVLSGDMQLELDNPKIGKGKMLSYWSIEKKNSKLLIKPILADEKELIVKFLSTEGGQLLQNNAQTKEIVKSVNKGTNLKEILPEVNAKKHYSFAGWFKAVSTNNKKEVGEKVDVEDMEITDSKGEYYAKFYPDFNENNIDDRTEEITVKFVTNSDRKFKDIKTHVGKKIQLPALKKKESVFMGWYRDEEFKNKFTEDILTDSQTLYAKWEKAEKVIEESQNKPIADKDISDQVERVLKERLQGYGNATTTPNSNVKAASTMPSNNTASNPSENNLETIVEKSPSTYEGNTSTGTSFKETKHVFSNDKIGKEFMVKFFENDGSFLFSIILPYGKTVKIYDENEKERGEYAVRHNTSITLDPKDYVNEKSILLGFDSREVRINSTQITEVFPEVAVNSAVIAQEKRAMAMEEERAAENKNAIMYLILALIIVVGGIGSYLFIKKRKKAKLHEEVETI